MNYQVDLHGLVASDAKKKLERLVATRPPKYTQITVIHGHRQGDAISRMVRGRSFNPKRVKQKILTLNAGETILLLHPPATASKEK